MQYQEDKFLNAVVFFGKNTDPKKFGITKLLKLLFFADFLHYEKYGRPIVGDTYYRLPEGPVPTLSYDLYKETFNQGKKTGLEEYVKIVKEKVRDYEITRIEPIKEFNENVFSESDMEVMKEIAEKFYDVTGSKLAGITHEIPFIKETPRVFPIDYLNAIEDKGERKYLADLQQEEEESECLSAK
jgi:uncharacterized phage-associated protein